MTVQYMPGFGNDFETEALPGALPQGQNSPQKCNYGLYGEQLSGTAFTAPSHQNERTWCYRIRPSVKHSHRYAKIDLPYWKSAPHIVDDVVSLGQYRWDPVSNDEGAELTWMTGMRTMTTAGDVNTQVGMASHVYLVTQSMRDDYFYSADSELLVVPQEGRLRFCTELGVIDLEPKEIAIIPRGLVYRVELVAGQHQSFSNACRYLELVPTWPQELQDLAGPFLTSQAASGCGEGIMDIDRAQDLTNTFAISFLESIFRGGEMIDPETTEIPDDVIFMAK